MRISQFTLFFIPVFLFLTSSKELLAHERLNHISCSPSLLHRNETLFLFFSQDRPPSLQELAISSPKGEWFFLQGKSLEDSFMPQKRFQKISRIEILPHETKATQWTNGAKEKKVIIKEPGDYTVYLGDNLETEFENALVFQCRFRFINEFK